eukprot:4466863-Pleurochrysis_carterae.AAC.7
MHPPSRRHARAGPLAGMHARSQACTRARRHARALETRARLHVHAQACACLPMDASACSHFVPVIFSRTQPRTHARTALLSTTPISVRACC